MRFSFYFVSILGLALFFSRIGLGVSTIAEPRVSLTNSEEIQEYARGVTDNINSTAVAILSVSPDQQTFENTLRPWHQLLARVSQDLSALDALRELNSPYDSTASQTSDDLCAYLCEVAQYPALHYTLMCCSRNTAYNAELDPFQRYLGARFLQNNSKEPVYLPGAAEEKTNSAMNFSDLELKSESLSVVQTSDLADRIFSKDVDVVYIQEIVTDDDAHDLYKVLRGHYAHFIYVPPKTVLDFPASASENGLLIASKYPLQQPQCKEIRKEASSINDCIILCGGHADVSATRDTEGNSSVEGRVSTSHESDNGKKYSAQISGGVEKDRKGKVSGKAEAKVGVDW